MSDEEFLARWSRRKAEARARNDAAAPVGPAEAPGADRCPPRDDHPGEEPDLSDLPSIESITAATDLTPFLRGGIPAEMSRAALRRAWVSDPAIRDFAGLAENAWDFNDPAAMPGFGPLDYSAEQLDALVRRIVGGIADAVETPDRLAETVENTVPSRPAVPEEDAMGGIVAPRAPDASGSVRSENTPAASQPESAASTDDRPTALGRRRHGGALPS